MADSSRSRKVQIILNDSINQRLNQAARQGGVTKSAFVRVALEREFALEGRLEDQIASGDHSSKKELEDNRLQLRLFD